MSVKFDQDYERLLSYTKELNFLLHNYKIKESQRSLLVSGILVSLGNDVFRNSYFNHKTANQICASLLQTIDEELSGAVISNDKRLFLSRSFSFILTNTTLTDDRDFLVGLVKTIDENVYQFIKTYKYFDTLGQFYIEFLRYANHDKGLGIVLTPPHISELFCDLAVVGSDSVVFDNCCGTGGFLVSAMKRVVESAQLDEHKIQNIEQKQIIGIEYQDDIFALSVSNAILQGDGKIGLLCGDCFKLIDEVKRRFKPTIGFLNPPYKSKKTKVEEWEFVLNNLAALERDGICIAIIPMSCVINTTGTILELKKRLLCNHTLLAVMSMPEELFHNSKVNVPTCIVVIRAHIPHAADQKTWFAYWRDDGFEKTKDRGRVDLHHQWTKRHQEWVSAFRNREQGKISTLKRVLPDEEWCAEAELLPDYSSITKESLTLDAKKYLAYRLLHELLNFDLSLLRVRYGSENNLVMLERLFEVKNGLASSNIYLKKEPESDFDIRYIRPSQSYSGSIAGYVDKTAVDAKLIYPDETIYVSIDGQGSHSFSYVSSFEFVPNSNVSVLIPRRSMGILEKLYYAACVTLNRFKFSYGRKPRGKRLKKLLIPEFPPDFVFDDIFADIIKNWQKLIKK